jgi:glycosyltransferase involved in cell wall biosynthesis
MSPDESTPAPDAITVVIPTQNRAALLQRTLRSVAEQSLPAAEVIVADDGSTDDTAEVAHAFGARYVLNPKGDWGPAAARNEGMRLAQTRYVAFIDSDDLYRPRALERLHEALDGQDDAPFSFGRGLAARHERGGWESDGIIAPNQRELDDFLCSLYARNSIPSGGGLVRRDTALALGGFDPRSVFAQDHAFWIMLARQGAPVHVPEIVCIHRRHGGNRMSPTVASDYDELITGIAREDDRLAGCVPRRRGVQFCELAIDAVHRRSISGLRLAASRLLSGGHYLEVLRAAGAYWRARRASGVQGATLLAGDTDLRDWLANYH